MLPIVSTHFYTKSFSSHVMLMVWCALRKWVSALSGTVCKLKVTAEWDQGLRCEDSTGASMHECHPCPQSEVTVAYFLIVKWLSRVDTVVLERWGGTTVLRCSESAAMKFRKEEKENPYAGNRGRALCPSVVLGPRPVPDKLKALT